MKIERLVHRRVGAALRRHRMIEEGDRIMVAFSGGVDSFVLARILAEKRSAIPVKFELIGCHVATDIVDMKEDGWEISQNFFGALRIPLVRMDVEVTGRSDRGRPMNCFFCAMQRRKALISQALKNDCTKIAYGHHLDDVIETLLINMFYNAEISTMPARLELDNYDLVIVRPLCLVKESEVKRYAARMELEAVVEPCPHGDKGKRARVKQMIHEMALEDGRVRDNLAASLGRIKLGYLLEKLRK